jgi:hypothetical protein
MFGGTAGNSSGFGKRLTPVIVRPNGILPTTFAGDVSSQLYQGIAGFNRLTYCVRITPTGGTSQAQMRLSWILTPSTTGSPADECLALRRDTTDAEIDDLNLPSVTAQQSFIVPVFNPGGAYGLRLSLREVGLPGTPGFALVTLVGVS